MDLLRAGRDASDGKAAPPQSTASQDHPMLTTPSLQVPQKGSEALSSQRQAEKEDRDQGVVHGVYNACLACSQQPHH